MPTEIYDELEWDISDFPTGFSTPDDLFETTHDATAECPNCCSRINGTAYYWSHNEDMYDGWLHMIDYEDCDCDEDESELEDYLND